MALKRRFNIEPTFSMASMTDMVFLLLLFFMITSTIVVPTSIKVLLPRAQQQTQIRPVTRVFINAQGNFFVANGNERERQVQFEEILPFLQSVREANPDAFVALYADEIVPYREVMRVVEVSNRNQLGMVLMVRPR
jgi:biopolymer transport protein ExbD